MLPELQVRYDAIEHRKEALLDHLRSLNDTQLRYRPAPNAWSLLQIAQHLVLLEELVMKGITREPRPGLRRRWWHRIGVSMVAFVFRHGLRVPAPTKKVVPVAEPPLEQTVAQWKELRSRMAAFLESATPERAAMLGFRHPVSGPFDIASSLDFVAVHHDHHLRQIARLEERAGILTGGLNSRHMPSSS